MPQTAERKRWLYANDPEYKLRAKLYSDKSRARPEAREIAKQRTKEWNLANPDKKKHNALRWNYAITLDEYCTLLEKQKHCCMICKVHVSELSRNLCVDHDHTTGTVRGLLCSNCNTALGLLKDNTTLLENAVNYLRGQNA